MQQVDAGLGALAAVEDDLDLGPVGLAGGDLLGLGAADVVVEAGLAAQRVGLDPGAETIFGVRLELDVGEEARVSLATGDGAHGVLAGTDVLRVDDDAPVGVLVARALAVVAALPTERGLLVVSDFFEAGIGQQVRAFDVGRGLVLLGEQAGSLVEPFVGLHRRISGELTHERLDLRGSREIGELHEGGQSGGRGLVGHDARAEEELLGGGVGAEGADRIATQLG